MMNTQPQKNGPLGLSPDKLNSLLGMAGQKLGQDPQQLKKHLESGQVGQMLNNLDPQKAAQINQLLNNPHQLEQFLGSPQVKAMLNTLMSQKQ